MPADREAPRVIEVYECPTCGRWLPGGAECYGYPIGSEAHAPAAAVRRTYRRDPSDRERLVEEAATGLLREMLPESDYPVRLSADPDWYRRHASAAIRAAFPGLLDDPEGGGE